MNNKEIYNLIENIKQAEQMGKLLRLLTIGCIAILTALVIALIIWVIIPT